MSTQNTFYDELVTSDWLGRNSTDYTYALGKATSGWQESLGKGEANSRYLVDLSGTTNVNMFVAKCTSTVRTIATTLNKGKAMRVNLTRAFNSFTDGSNFITVTTEPLYCEDKEYFPTLNHRLDPVVGYAVHEMAHVLYTDEDYDKYLKKLAKKPLELKIKGNLMNLLEDERIENLIAQNYSGYTGYLGRSKDYCFGYKFAKEKEAIDLSNELTALMNTLITLIRYPKSLEAEQVNKFEPEIREVMAILKDYPTNTQELGVAVDKIYEVLRKYTQQQNKQKQEQQQEDSTIEGKGEGEQENDPNSEETDQDGEQSNEEEKQPQSEGNGQDGADGDEGEDGEETETDEKGGNGGENSEEEEEEKGSGGGGSDDDMTEEMEADLAEQMAEQLSELLDALSNSEAGIPVDANELAENLKEGAPCNTSTSTGQQLKQILEATGEELDKRKGLAMKFPELNGLACNELNLYVADPNDMNISSKYTESYEKVAMFAGSLRAKLMELNRNVQVTNKNLYEGDFDQDSLVDALMGAQNVYSETFTVTNKGAVIVLLVDESGSMEYGDKYKRARELAIMFERALEGVNNIDFYCYGHTTARDDVFRDIDETNMYRDQSSTLLIPYFEGRTNGKRENLGKIFQHGGNRDGHAIVETVARVRQSVPMDKKLIMFVLSDGEPSASVPEGYSKIGYTKKCVDTVERDMNTDCIHIALDDCPSEEMFNKYVKFDGNYSQVIHTLGAMLNKIVTDNQGLITI